MCFKPYALSHAASYSVTLLNLKPRCKNLAEGLFYPLLRYRSLELINAGQQLEFPQDTRGSPLHDSKCSPYRITSKVGLSTVQCDPMTNTEQDEQIGSRRYWLEFCQEAYLCTLLELISFLTDQIFKSVFFFFAPPRHLPQLLPLVFF